MTRCARVEHMTTRPHNSVRGITYWETSSKWNRVVFESPFTPFKEEVEVGGDSGRGLREMLLLDVREVRPVRPRGNDTLAGDADEAGAAEDVAMSPSGT